MRLTFWQLGLAVVGAAVVFALGLLPGAWSPVLPAGDTAQAESALSCGATCTVTATPAITATLTSSPTITTTLTLTSTVTLTSSPTVTSTLTATATPPPGSIAGAVIDSQTRQGINGARVVAADGPSPIQVAATNSSGSYFLFGLWPGAYNVTAGASGYLSTTVSVNVTSGSVSSQNFSIVLLTPTVTSTATATATATPSPTGTATATATRTPIPGTIYGRVTDQSTGLSIAGADLQATSGPSSPISVTADSSGFYLLQSLWPGAYQVMAGYTGYVSETEMITVTSGTLISADFALPADTPTATATMTATATATTTATPSPTPRPGSIQGLVMDSGSGAPLDGALVETSGGPNPAETATTDSFGQYVLLGLWPGSYQVTAGETGYVSTTLPISVASDTSSLLDFSLVRFTPTPTPTSTTTPTSTQTPTITVTPHPGAIGGTVRDSGTNGPLFGAVVESSGGPSPLETVTTSSSGSYLLSNLWPGVYNVSASASGYVGSSQVITVTSGITSAGLFNLITATVTPTWTATATATATPTVTQTPTITATPTVTPVPGSIAGLVLGSDGGRKLAGAGVLAAGGPSPRETAITDANGAYTLVNLWPGTYNVMASDTGYYSSTQQIAVVSGGTPSAGFFVLTVIPTATSTPAVVSTTLAIDAGWNLIALPVQPLTPVSLEGVAQLAAQSQITPVAVVEWAQGQFQVHLAGQQDTYASDPVQLNEGYFVRTTGSGTLALSGTQITTGQAVTFQIGWNLIAVPSSSIGPLTLQTLGQAAHSATNQTVVAVVEWTQGQFQVHLVGQTDTFANDPVNSGAGYFVRMSGAGTWTP